MVGRRGRARGRGGVVGVAVVVAVEGAGGRAADLGGEVVVAHGRAGGRREAVEVGRRGTLGGDFCLYGREERGRGVGGGVAVVWGHFWRVPALREGRALCRARVPFFVGVAVAEVTVCPAGMRLAYSALVIFKCICKRGISPLSSRTRLSSSAILFRRRVFSSTLGSSLRHIKINNLY